MKFYRWGAVIVLILLVLLGWTLISMEYQRDRADRDLRELVQQQEKRIERLELIEDYLRRGYGRLPGK